MADGREHARGAVAVLNVGGVDPCCKQTARVGEDMTLAALDLLARVKAPWAAAFRGLHPLAVDDHGRRAGLAPLGLARRHKQTVIDTRLQLVIPPHRETALHRRTRMAFTTSRKSVGARPPQGTGRRHMRLDQAPFFIGDVACLT